MLSAAISLNQFLRYIIPAPTSVATSGPHDIAAMANAKGIVLPGPLPVTRVSSATTGSPVISASLTIDSNPG